MTTANITSINSSQNIDSGYNIYLVDVSNSDITLVLPYITSDGYYFTFRRVDNTPANTLTITGDNSSQKIDNLASITLSGNTSISLVSYGGVWWRL